MINAVVFSDTYVWTTFIQIAILFAAILAGNVLRTCIPVLKNFYIPSAILGGIIILLLKLIPAVHDYIDNATMQIITYHCLGLGFSAMALKTANKKRRVPTIKIIESGVIMASSYLIQAIVGLVISIVGYFAADWFYAAGLILPMGFGQSTGSALSWGSKYETSFGFSGGASYGLAIASCGFIIGSVVGIVYLNIVGRKKRTTFRKSVAEDSVRTLEGDGIKGSESVDKMTLQMCFVVLAYLVSFGFMSLLSMTGVNAIKDLAWGLNFLWSLGAGFLIKLILNFLTKKKLTHPNFVSDELMDRISGFMFDTMIVAGVAAIEFDDVVHNLPMLVITCLLGTVVTFVYVKKATKKIYRGYETEGFLTNFGTVTGTVSTGMILLREVDPDYVTPAASNIVLQNIPSLVLLAPLLLTLGFAATSLKNTFIMLGVYSVLFAGYNIFLFRKNNRNRKIKKGSNGKARE